MKSVLGGLFRIGNSQAKDVDEFCKKVIQRNLVPGGFLVTLDNGATSLENKLHRFGARRNRWRFFSPEDFHDFYAQECFGWLSAFSVRTRLGDRIGVPFESFLYQIDKVRWAIKPSKHPSVIVTIFKSSTPRV